MLGLSTLIRWCRERTVKRVRRYKRTVAYYQGLEAAARYERGQSVARSVERHFAEPTRLRRPRVGVLEALTASIEADGGELEV